MYWINTNVGNTVILLIVSVIIAAVIVSSFSIKKPDESFFHLTSPMSDSTVVILTIILGIAITCGIDADYARINPHHLHLTDKINYFDPYDGWHYWPHDDQFCTAEGDRITLDEAWALYEEAHDVVRDLEGNVTAVYPKGEAPESELTGRSANCPYYLDNMTEEQQDAYLAAKDIVENNNISRSTLYDWLTNEYPYYYDSDTISFAIEALEENRIVDWYQECMDSFNDYIFYRTEYTREDVYDHLASKGFTSEEAEEVILLCNE